MTLSLKPDLYLAYDPCDECRTTKKETVAQLFRIYTLAKVCAEGCVVSLATRCQTSGVYILENTAGVAYLILRVRDTCCVALHFFSAEFSSFLTSRGYESGSRLEPLFLASGTLEGVRSENHTMPLKHPKTAKNAVRCSGGTLHMLDTAGR